MKIFSRLVFLSIAFFLSLTSISGQEKFDLVTFTAPKGWQKEVGPAGDTLRFSKEDSAKNVFALITVFKATPADANPKENFDSAWLELVQKTIGAESPTMQPIEEENGWTAHTGLAQFQKEGLSGAVLLITATAENRMVNILFVTNTDIFQKEAEVFFASVKLSKIATASAKAQPPLATQSSNRSIGKPELWLNRRIATSIYSNPPTLDDLYLIYPNGDYFPNVPYEGLRNVNKSYQPESWGKFTLRGNKGRFKNNYDEIAVTKKSDILMEKDGYTYGFHRFLSVDGLRIDGAYTHVSPEWGKDPKLNYLSGAGCQFVINFNKDGTFDDKGIFSTNKENCTGGRGTYSIENFTITFRYNDGRIDYRLLTAPPTRNPETYDETIYIGHTAHYKKSN